MIYLHEAVYYPRSYWPLIVLLRSNEHVATANTFGHYHFCGHFRYVLLVVFIIYYLIYLIRSVLETFYSNFFHFSRKSWKHHSLPYKSTSFSNSKFSNCRIHNRWHSLKFTSRNRLILKHFCECWLFMCKHLLQFSTFWWLLMSCDYLTCKKLWKFATYQSISLIYFNASWLVINITLSK